MAEQKKNNADKDAAAAKVKQKQLKKKMSIQFETIMDASKNLPLSIKIPSCEIIKVL